MIRCPRLSTTILTISLICALPLTTLQKPKENFAQAANPISETPIVTPAVDLVQKEEVRYERLVSFLSEHYNRPRHQVESIVEETVAHAESENIDPILFLALIATESSFNPNAVSPKGAIGLVQVIPRYHPTKINAITRSGKRPTDIRENIKMGVAILSEYRAIHNGDMRKALLSYNGSLKDTRGRYASKIMAERRRLEGLSSPEQMRAVSVMAANE